MQKEKTNVKLIISGMTCVNCQNRIEKKLKEADGIISVSVSYKNGTAQIGYDDGKISLNKIIADIENLGYKVLKEKQKSNIVNLIYMLVIIISLYVML
ncbi:MAG: cation transporter [Enterocloster sp.]